ncbi:VVA0879 family protein [Yokenella regensburgei]|uniref:VVA0879 family protein n=1 Tax=Yokenella regensburgei TaxID=158877 RepID=UPI003EDAA52C
MKTLTLEEYRALLNAQGVDALDWAVVCPMCGTVQSSRLLVQAGAGKDFYDVNQYWGFNCIGRFTGKGSPSEEKGKNHGCNWSLSGLFQMHELEVITEDGMHHPRFEPATSEQAQALANHQGDL